MRTTIQIDNDVLSAARVLARLDGQTIGQVISGLARRGLRPTTADGAVEGFPVFRVAADAPLIGEELVRVALEDDD
jgi:hypothetical protein